MAFKLTEHRTGRTLCISPVDTGTVFLLPCVALLLNLDFYPPLAPSPLTNNLLAADFPPAEHTNSVRTFIGRAPTDVYVRP